jgi:hypothetical protein
MEYKSLNNAIDLLLESEHITITAVLCVDDKVQEWNIIAECQPKRNLYPHFDTLTKLGYELSKIGIDGDNECLLLEYSMDI